MDEKLGIDNLKVAIVAVINLAERIETKFADDGKISLAEALSVGAGSFGDVVRVVKSGKLIKAEFTDLDDEEKAELFELIKSELDLENDKIENIVEKAIEFLLTLDVLISSLK